MSCVRWTLILLLVALPSALAGAEKRYETSGVVLSVDPARRTMTVSGHEIPGFMGAMVMSYNVPDSKALKPLTRGTLVDFTLVVGKDSSHVENIRVRRYESTEREPSKSRRLRTFEEALRGPLPRLAVGQTVPDFHLSDQQKRPIHFRQFAGKVVAINFVYTRCALPEYCLRSTNNFGAIQKQFQNRLGKDLILLTVTFDPVHDQPAVLRDYARTWKADPENWRFLTGEVADVQQVCDLFGVNYVPDEGLYVHSLHSAIVGRDGKLVANLEGNEFTSQQFADLLKTVLDPAQ